MNSPSPGEGDGGDEYMGRRNMMMGNRHHRGFNCPGHFSVLTLRISSLLLSIFLLSSPLRAGLKTGADFLKIPIGARPVSLGQAYTALANDVDSLNWNVAGLAQMPSVGRNSAGGFSFSHINVLDENNLDNIGVALPLNRIGTGSHIGFSVTRFSIQNQERRGSDREMRGTFGGDDLALGLAFATRLDGVNLGSQFKLIRQNLAGETANGMAVDLGFICPTGVSGVSLGGSVRNWGTKMKFIQEEYSLPLTLSVGMVYQPINSLSLVMDFHQRPYQNQSFLALGTEITPLNSIGIRLGYLAKLADAVVNNQKNETNRGTMSGLNGMSGGLRFTVSKLNIDYAFTPFGELGNSQTITISSFFGGWSQSAAKESESDKSMGAEPSQEPQKSGECPSCENKNILVIPLENDVLNKNKGKER